MNKISLKDFINSNVITVDSNANLSLAYEGSDGIRTLIARESYILNDNTAYGDLESSILELLLRELEIIEISDNDVEAQLQINNYKNAIARDSRRGVANFLIDVDGETSILVYSSETQVADKIIKAVKKQNSDTYTVYYSPEIKKLCRLIKTK